MLRSARSIFGYCLGAFDGEIGKVRDVLFDDREWIVRYFVADTGNWLADRLVLVSPSAVRRAEYDRRVLAVDLTRDQVNRSPLLESDRPVSRQKESELSRYYGWPMYWNPVMAGAGAGIMPGPWLDLPAERDPEADGVSEPHEKAGDPHLRSAREVIGYHVEASDGAIGHVDDFICDEGGWVIQYVVVDTRNWWPARKVVMLPMWISGVSWETRRVRFDLPRETIRNGPEYDPAAAVNQETETLFYDYYGRPRGRLS
jgi:hypothetical protein